MHRHASIMPVYRKLGDGDAMAGFRKTYATLAATRPVYDLLGPPKARTLRYYDGLFHEVFNEPERDRVIADLAVWIEAHR